MSETAEARAGQQRPPAPNQGVRVVKCWGAFWHAPVASVRPYLLVKGLMLLLAMDAWLLRAPHSAWYGFGGFDVAHFGWLDAIGPSPSPTLYGGVQFLIGLLALFLFLMPLNRIVAAAIFLLWTYGWLMSRLDSDPQHYLISSVLFCIVLFPTVGRDDPRLRVGAWAFKLLGAIMAFLYFGMSIAACHSAWLFGETLQMVDWSGVIVIELIVATGYLAAVRQENQPRGTIRLMLSVGLLAVVWQAGFEAPGLQSGLLRYCMTLTACAFFLPEKWLCAVRRFVDRGLSPLEFLFQQLQKALPDLWPCVPTVVMAVIVAAVLGLCGRAIGMPGAFAAGTLAGGALAAAAIYAAFRNVPQVADRYNIAGCIAGLAMWLVVSVSSAQFDYHLLRGNQLLKKGLPDDALTALETAGRFVGRSAAAHLDLGDAFFCQGSIEEAETHYREAVQLDPKLAGVHCKLGDICFRRGDYPAALQHYQDALLIDPEHADARRNLRLARAKIVRGGRFQ